MVKDGNVVLETKEASLDTLWDYEINFQVPRPVLQDAENRDLVHDFTGKILHRHEGKCGVVGSIRGQRLDWGGCLERKESLFEVCDADSQELCEIQEAIFVPDTYDFKEGLGLDWFGDVLAIHEIKIAKQHRGKGLGLLALLQTMITMGSGGSVAVIKPFPLQYAGKCNDQNKERVAKAQAKLRQYWQRLGFAPVKGTDFYYFNLAWRMPKPEKLLGR